MVFTYFVIVGRGDACLFEYASPTDVKENKLQLRQFIMHAALDAVDEAMWTNPSFYLRCVDRYDDYHISAYVALGPLKFLIMQDCEPSDMVRAFFVEIYELCVKLLANPFTDMAASSASKEFAVRSELLFKKYF